MFQASYSQMLQQLHNFKPFMTAHFDFAAKHIIHDEYQYDPTDDGPEIGVIRRESLIQNFEVCGA